jgi:hypothetical protein
MMTAYSFVALVELMQKGNFAPEIAALNKQLARFYSSMLCGIWRTNGKLFKEPVPAPKFFYRGLHGQSSNFVVGECMDKTLRLRRLPSSSRRIECSFLVSISTIRKIFSDCWIENGPKTI